MLAGICKTGRISVLFAQRVFKESEYGWMLLVKPRIDLFRDSLKRHVATHGKEASGIYASRAAAESTRAAHACRVCSTSKKRCGGLDPCSQCARKGQNCIYDYRHGRQNILPCDAMGSCATWLSNMPASESASASARSRDVEESIPTALTDHSRPATISYDAMVDDGVHVCQNYNSELNQPGRWSQQDLAFDLMFDPFVFWGSGETAGMLSNPLSNGNLGITTPTINNEELHLSHAGYAIQGESSRQNREAETAQVNNVTQAKGTEIQILQWDEISFRTPPISETPTSPFILHRNAYTSCRLQICIKDTKY
jgi:hypothetical protein